MPTDLIFYVVDKAFRINRYWPKTPLGWNATANRFTYDNHHPLKFFRWYFTIFVLFTAVTTANCGYVIYGHFVNPRPRLNLGHVAMYILVLLTMTLVTVLTIFILSYGDEIVNLINKQLKIYEEVNVLENKKTNAFKDKRKKPGLMGMFNQVCVIFGILSIRLPSGRLDISGKFFLDR